MTRIEEQILMNQEIIMEALCSILPDDIYKRNLNNFASTSIQLRKEEREKVTDFREDKRMFKWVYKATIYRQMDGKVLLDKNFETEEGAECFIEQNIKEFDDDDYSPTGHVCKNYIQVN